MTLSEAIYIYAQSLDNFGATEWWRCKKIGIFEKNVSKKDNYRGVIDIIDEVQASGRSWLSGSENIIFKVTWNGNCVIKVKPITRDQGGRISPVLVIYNVYSDRLQLAAKALANLPDITGREFDGTEKVIATKLSALLALPRWAIFLHFILFSRKVSND